MSASQSSEQSTGLPTSLVYRMSCEHFSRPLLEQQVWTQISPGHTWCLKRMIQSSAGIKVLKSGPSYHAQLGTMEQPILLSVLIKDRETGHNCRSGPPAACNDKPSSKPACLLK